MSKEVKDEPKKRGHRKKKFGDEESIVASWRVGKDTYKEKREEIRKKVNNVLESYSVNKKVVKKEISDDIEKPISNIENINENVKIEKDNEEKIFIIDRDVYEQRDYAKEFTNKDELEQPEENRKNTEKSDPNEVLSYFDRFKDNNKKTQAQVDFIKRNESELTERDSRDLREDYEHYREAIDEQVQGDITETNDQEENDTRSLEDIYEEFKDVIDPNNPIFKKFLRK
ncbi:hypothetical protein LCGC14_0818500 [marine sediment metagenome]|uniref:Uncharacterized protein n=1 Tax=marine sediment metagenome TaxID=412755 RepID=A0A0F9PJG8_9ZZZZ